MYKGPRRLTHGNRSKFTSSADTKQMRVCRANMNELPFGRLHGIRRISRRSMQLMHSFASNPSAPFWLMAFCCETCCPTLLTQSLSLCHVGFICFLCDISPLPFLPLKDILSLTTAAAALLPLLLLVRFPCSRNQCSAQSDCSSWASMLLVRWRLQPTGRCWPIYLSA